MLQNSLDSTKLKYDLALLLTSLRSADASYLIDKTVHSLIPTSSLADQIYSLLA